MQRNKAVILVEVDMDPVPGWGNDQEDYVNHIQHLLDQTIPHYNPIVTFLRIQKPSDESSDHHGDEDVEPWPVPEGEGDTAKPSDDRVSPSA